MRYWIWLTLVFVVGCTGNSSTSAVGGKPKSIEENEIEVAAWDAGENEDENDDEGADDQFAPIRILAWNIESGGSDIEKILTQLNNCPFNILCLSEVGADDTQRVEQRFAKEQVFIGSQGGDDRLVNVIPADYEVIETIELLDWEGAAVSPEGRPVPLINHLRVPGGREFLVMNNHLARSDADARTRQAEILVEFAQSKSLPIVAVGDYNMDYDFPSKKGNAAFSAIRKGGTFKWIRPEELVDTNWADADGDGADDYPNSMLDFTFVAGDAKSWNVIAEVISWDGDFPDDETTSDHRPVLTGILANE